MNRPFDLLVVGSGIAGLYAALLAAPDRRVLLVTKGALEESNTRYAQGGIAVALAENDSAELHLRDTVAAGDGLCDAGQVAILTSEGPQCIQDLLHRGVPFDREHGRLAWTREAAHSLPRVLHADGDATGASVEKALAVAVRSAGVVIQEQALCTALRTRDGQVTGASLLLPDGHTTDIEAKHVLLATGGAGQLFMRTTNPPVATGDGLALAYRAGAELMDLEFMQFHPTALMLSGAPSFLISEAVRGEGGILRDDSGQAFMERFHPDAELAPRDVVARAIHTQMSETGANHAWLDLRHMDSERICRRFPSIVQFCRNHGIDPITEPIPVAPAAHYWMGGIRTDADGRTTVPGLWACGEVACTGVHGANRLASNSLLEGLVFARRAVGSILNSVPENGMLSPGRELPSCIAPDSGLPEGDLQVCRRVVARALWDGAGVVRSGASLLAARDTIAGLHRPAGRRATTLAEHEFTNLRLLAGLLIESALTREESRGAHFRTDFQDRDPAWLGHIVVSRQGRRIVPAGTGVRAPQAAHA